MLFLRLPPRDICFFPKIFERNPVSTRLSLQPRQVESQSTLLAVSHCISYSFKYVSMTAAKTFRRRIHLRFFPGMQILYRSSAYFLEEHTEVWSECSLRTRLNGSIVLIQALPPSTNYLGIVSDHRLLSWFYSYAERTPSFMQYISNSLHSLSLPSLSIYSAVVASTSSKSVLDAMKLMSEEGVSSVAVVDEETSMLLSAVSVTDIGKVRANMTGRHRQLTSCASDCSSVTEQPNTLHASKSVRFSNQGLQLFRCHLCSAWTDFCYRSQTGQQMGLTNILVKTCS